MNTDHESGEQNGAEVERLKELVRILPINAKVRLHLKDGSSVRGIVTVTPTVQVVRDHEGDESLAGTIKLEDPVQPGWTGLVELADIASVEHLDSVTMGSTKA